MSSGPGPHWKEYQKRVWEECQELKARRDRLGSFIGSDVFKSLPVAEQGRMQMQHQVMGEYADILDARIAAFE